MFNIKYNLLSGINVAFGVLNFAIFIAIFGVSVESDSYLLAGVTVTTLHLMQVVFVEQFLIFYAEQKNNSEQKAYSFYVSILIVSIIVGVLSVSAFFFLKEHLFMIFGSGFNETQYKLYDTYMSISAFELLVAPILFINQRLLNAESRFSMPYIFSMFPALGVFLASLYLLFFSKSYVEILLISKLIFLFLSVTLSLGYIKITIFKGLGKVQLISWSQLLGFVKNSFGMRIGHNIHNILMMPVISNYLSSYPAGTVSIFFYAHKFSSIIVSVVTGPSKNILSARISNAVAEKDKSGTKSYIKEFLKYAPLFLTTAALFAYFIIPFALPFINSEFSQGQISNLMYMFSLLMIWSFVVVIESPWVAVLIAKKNSSQFIFVNAIFIISLFLGLNYLFQESGVYMVAYLLIFSQLFSLCLYFIYARKYCNS